MTTALGRYFVNPLVRRAIELGVGPPAYAILETVGRKTSEPRRTPVGNGLKGDTFWIVAEHGRRAGYVRNIAANPRVRVKAGGRWRCGERLRRTPRTPSEEGASASSQPSPSRAPVATGATNGLPFFISGTQALAVPMPFRRV
ncbi:MAG: nitroreductase/quinone reductase family protein [Gaiellaceae bacterium]